MNRREFLKNASIFTVGNMLLPNLSFGAQDEWLKQFNQNLKNKPWLIGLQGINKDQIQSSNIKIEGKIPKEINGYLYRNGPANNQPFNTRYHHWFDGDGMVQQFHINAGKVSHLGKMIKTHKYLSEKQQQKNIYPTFGTSKKTRFKSADELNVSNISLLPINKQLFSLWEGGSAYEIAPKTLDTIGIKTWSAKTKGVPFGAHYRKDKDGSIWNIGYASLNDAIVLWHIDKYAKLKKTKILPIKNVPMLHDFLITEKYIILVLHPYNFDKNKFKDGYSFLESHQFYKNKETKVWLIDKNTLDITHTFELASQFVFHFVNAYEQKDEIVFESMRYPNANILLDLGNIMKGVTPTSKLATHHKIRLNLNKNTAKEYQLNKIGSEFPNIIESETGLSHTKMLSLQQRGDILFNTVSIMDNITNKSQYFSYANQLAEEHIIIKNHKGSDWVIGTTLDYKNNNTKLNIFNADYLGDGPIAIATLPYILPLGLHGKFVYG